MHAEGPAGEDYYAILGVARDASTDEIRRAYRKLAIQWHPDKNPSEQAGNKFKKISEAYQVLSDPQTRRQYDESLRGGRARANASSFHPFFSDPEDVFRQFFREFGMRSSFFDSPFSSGGFSPFSSRSGFSRGSRSHRIDIDDDDDDFFGPGASSLFTRMSSEPMFSTSGWSRPRQGRPGGVSTTKTTTITFDGEKTITRTETTRTNADGTTESTSEEVIEDTTTGERTTRTFSSSGNAALRSNQTPALRNSTNQTTVRTKRSSDEREKKEDKKTKKKERKTSKH